MTTPSRLDSFKSRRTLTVGGKKYDYFSLAALSEKGFDLSKMPLSMKIFVENLLRHEDGFVVKKGDIEAVAKTVGVLPAEREVFFMPARVVMQDFTGVPAIVDLASMRDAIQKLGGDAKRINPFQPVDLVIDHSVQVDFFGASDAFEKNSEIEFERNQERYSFLKWGQKAFANFRAVPPETGIVHQVNLEYLAKVVWTKDGLAYPDTVIGTDSHTTMINGLGVVGWGVGGIEAEAAMLGQAMPMLIPEVVGFRLTGKLPEGATATDAVLTVTELLRAKGVVGKFVEFYGPGLASLALSHRPRDDREHGPRVRRDGRLLPGRLPHARLPAPVRPPRGGDRARRGLLQGAGLVPRRQERAVLRRIALAGSRFRQTVPRGAEAASGSHRAGLGQVAVARRGSPRLPQGEGQEGQYSRPRRNGSRHQGLQDRPRRMLIGGDHFHLHEHINPSVLIAAGLVAQKAAAKGLSVKPWVKTSLAPGSKVVMDYLKAAGLVEPLEKMKFHLVGYGCTTCIGNSGPLPIEVAQAVSEKNLVVAAVLSGNRNFEGRVNPLVKANYLASPPLVVAYAIAGTVDLDLTKDPIGNGKDGKPVFLKDIWPTNDEVAKAVGEERHSRGLRRKSTRQCSPGTHAKLHLKRGQGERGLCLGSEVHVRAPAAVLRRSLAQAASAQRHQGGSGAGAVRGLGDDGSHLSGRKYREGLACGAVPSGKGRQAFRLQQLRRAPGQS